MGYHRLHTHRGFKTYKWFEYFLAICGTLTLEGGPIFWVATHRLHHQHSDQPEDPHTPRVSGFWAHIGWMIFGEAHHNDTARMARYAPDLGEGPVLSVADDAITGCRSPCSASRCWRSADGDSSTGRSSCASWSACIRPGWSTRPRTCGAAVDSPPRDDSRNLWWVALVTFGEGWHNNHHAHPTSSRHGLAWYEFDPTWLLLKGAAGGRARLGRPVARISQIPRKICTATRRAAAVALS